MIKFSYMTSFYNKKIGRYVPSPEITPVSAQNWSEFATQLKSMQEIEYERKDVAPLISPAFYDNIARRKNDNVSGWSFLALDFDNGGENYVDFDDAVVWMESLGFSYVIYTTASSRPEQHKFRIFIPFNRTIEPDEMTTVWKGGFEYFGRLTDPQCKDKSRGYYVPGTYPGAHTDFAANVNNELDPDELKQLAPPEPLLPTPEPFEDRGYKFSWCSITDCPFVKQNWIDEYIALPNGCDQHYQTVYKFMLRVAGYAKSRSYRITETEIAQLAAELDLLKDKRWHNQGRSWYAEAKNAINYVYTMGSTPQVSPLKGYRKERK